MLILSGEEVRRFLAGRELELIDAARSVYETHAEGRGSLPHSTFLRFPGDSGNRIIALPAYVGGEFRVAGVKWISSFPGNLERGLDRASAVIVLNSTETGRPLAFLEGSVISAVRTAASAALAARALWAGDPPNAIGMVGCGPINFEIARFIRAALPTVEQLFVHDLDIDRATLFGKKCREELGFAVEILRNLKAALGISRLISFATTAVAPHVNDPAVFLPGATILHISLRDLAPEVILAHDNVVDDIDHVCRAQTSIHIAEQFVGNRDFIRCALADIILGRAVARKDAERAVIFSPFGLGSLDVAVGKLVYELATQRGGGATVSSFLPEPWSQKQ
ncbi:MAG: 2,3-diaminopropionate biosynthesis protein SbnB [Blastocatellia bacterium]